MIYFFSNCEVIILKLKDVFPAVVAIILLAFLISGCTTFQKQKVEKSSTSSDTQKEDKDLRSSSSATSCLKPEVDFNEKLNELEKTPMVVEVYVDGEKEGTWAQKENSWRFEDPKGMSVAIYRGNDRAFFLVDMEEKTALKIEGGSEKYQEDYQVFNPSTLIKDYKEYPFKLSGEKLMAEVDNVKVVVSFKGPDELISEIEVYKGSGFQIIEFKYLKVGDVPESLFEVPPEVKVFPTPPS
jgi:hypothetical protein